MQAGLPVYTKHTGKQAAGVAPGDCQLVMQTILSHEVGQDVLCLQYDRAAPGCPGNLHAC